LLVKHQDGKAVVFAASDEPVAEFEDLEQSQSRLAIAHELRFVGEMAVDDEEVDLRKRQDVNVRTEIERLQRTRRRHEKKQRHVRHAGFSTKTKRGYGPEKIQMRIVDVGNARPSRIHYPQRPAKQRPSSYKNLYKSPRMSRSRAGAWSSLDIRQEIREKLIVLQRGPYGKKIAGARRPKHEYPDPVDLQLALAARKAGCSGGGSAKEKEGNEGARMAQRPASARTRVTNAGPPQQNKQGRGTGGSRAKVRRPQSAQPRGRKDSSEGLPPSFTESAIELLESY
jgi:hypothetical protein